MLAVFALAAAATPQAEGTGWRLSGIALLFAIGAVGGMYRYTGTLGTDLAPARPHDAAIAELGGSSASFAGLAVGAPLSMTQAITGGIIGSSATRGWKRVRWPRAGRLALAWTLTLPTALLVGALVGAIARSAG
jgi:PiT family inorganic phosphate transporter